jgi:cytochrome c-type biogenesis protein CcmE
MSDLSSRYLRFGVAIAIVIVSLGYLAFTGVQQSKSYYVTIKELREMNDSRYAKRLRVAGNVMPGSIKRQGSRVEFALKENEFTLPVVYLGTEAPPDTFKDDSQAMAEGRFGRDGVFHANHLQAKCASKYAPAPDQPGAPGVQPTSEPAKPLQKAQAGTTNNAGLAQ